MKKMILGIVAILAFGLVQAQAYELVSADSYNNLHEPKMSAYGDGWFVKVETIVAVHEEISSKLNIDVNDYSESAGKVGVGIATGLEFKVLGFDHFYSDMGVEYINKGSSHTGEFFGHLVYKEAGWKLWAGGYFGGGIDKLKINSLTALGHII